MSESGSANRSNSRFFRWAAGLAIGLLIVGVILAIVLAATYSDANAGLPVLFVGAIYAVTGRADLLCQCGTRRPVVIEK